MFLIMHNDVFNTVDYCWFFKAICGVVLYTVVLVCVPESESNTTR